MHPDSAADHPLRFLFLDFNAYFASVEQHDDPALAGRPVMVIPLPSEHSGAIAASYEAKALGISRGTSVREARAICPNIVIRAARHERYVEMHNLLMAEIARHLPIARVYSIDECACRLDRGEAARKTALAKARAIKAGIAANIGPCLRASIGIAPNPLLAKLAAELEKPDGLVTIEARQLPGALNGLPLAAIPGVGPGIARRLERAGIGDFEALWALAPKHTRAIWGSVVGERFCYALHGHDIPDDAPREKKVIGHSRVLSPEHQRPAQARIVARALTLKAASRLRFCGLHASRMSLSLRIRPAGWIGNEAVFRSSQNSWVFLKALDGLWNEAMARLCNLTDRGGRIATVAIDLHGLGECGPQPDLFSPAEIEAADSRAARLWETIDNLNRRHRHPVITLGSHRGLDLNYLGVKIAFSRVPDPAEFNC